MTARLAFLVALGLLLSEGVLWSRSPEGEAEARLIYQKLWESLRAAKTVRLRTAAHFKTTDFEGDVAASLWAKEGNRMRLEIEVRGTKNRAPYAHRTRIISDGSKIRTREGADAWEEYATSPQWNEKLLLNALRGGLPTGLELVRIFPKEGAPKDAVGIGFLPLPEPSRFALWKPEELSGRSATPIEFQLESSPDFRKDCSTLLWLDARTGLPLRRMNVILSDRTLTVTETYEAVELNGAVEEARFEFPKE